MPATQVNSCAVPPRRAPLQARENKRCHVGELSPVMRALIIETAEAAFGEVATAELSRVVARRLCRYGVTQAAVDAVIFTAMQQHRRENATLRSGLKNVVALADEAGRDVWADERGVA